MTLVALTRASNPVSANKVSAAAELIDAEAKYRRNRYGAAGAPLRPANDHECEHCNDDQRHYLDQRRNELEPPADTHAAQLTSVKGHR